MIRNFTRPGFSLARGGYALPFTLSGDLKAQIEIFYIKEMPGAFEEPFLKEERQLLRTVADRAGAFIAYQKSQEMIRHLEEVKKGLSHKYSGEWSKIVELLRKTDS